MRKTVVVATLMLGLGVFCAPWAMAEDTEDIVKRLFFGDWQDAMKKGKVEFVIQPRFEFRDDGGDSEHEGTLVLELETFPGENWELELELDLYRYIHDEGPTETGVGSAELSIEYRFLHILDPVVDLRLGFEFVQPLGDVDEGLSDGFRRYVPKLSGRWQAGPVHIFARVAYEFLDHDFGRDDKRRKGRRGRKSGRFFGHGHGHDDDDGDDVLEYNVALFYPHNGWRFGAEFAGESSRGGGDEHESYAVPQIRWQKTGLDRKLRWDDFEIGVGIPIGLTDDSADWGIFMQGYFGFEFREGHSSTRNTHMFRRDSKR